jgi:hypothetical protein
MSESENFVQDGFDLKEVSLSGNTEMSESDKFSQEKSQAAIFALDGLDLYDAKIERKKHRKDALRLDGRYLRSSRRAREEVIEITYTFTAQGTYRVRLFCSSS